MVGIRPCAPEMNGWQSVRLFPELPDSLVGASERHCNPLKMLGGYQRG